MLLNTLTRLLLACLLLTVQCGIATAAGRYESARQAMVEIIAEGVRETSIYIDKVALDPRVMSAMGKVPRHEFVPLPLRPIAYENRPLPIGYGQTISQPYIVALMTDLLKPQADDRALEIGTGSGYQAAVLAELAKEIYSIEIIDALGERARSRLQALHYENIEVRTGDGYYGWDEHAPFDVIIVTAAASHIPPPLIRQLKRGGRMVIPIGGQFMVQQLVFVEKDHDGKVTTRQIMPVMFVPLTGKH
jgi:protein-L-isoaspartate(D-aspartate) O-methyltransferase